MVVQELKTTRRQPKRRHLPLDEKKFILSSERDLPRTVRSMQERKHVRFAVQRPVFSR